MPFDLIAWGAGYGATKGVSALLEKIFDVGAYQEIQAAGEKWSSELPDPIRTPADALFSINLANKPNQDSGSQAKLKEAMIELHNVPTENQWYDALIESWEFKRADLGAEANAFFQLDRPIAEEHLRKLAHAVFDACASVLKYSQPLLVRAVREIGITQSLMLHKLESFRSPLNDPERGSNAAITLSLDPTHVEEAQLHRLNEVSCVDSPAEVIAGRYRTHEIWIGPDGCSKEHASYVPLQSQYVGSKMKQLLHRWNAAAVDLAKCDLSDVTLALASFHHKFLQIHPYPDGNGRVARALLDLQIRNFTLAQSPLRLKSHDDYYLALRAADSGELQHLVGLIITILKRELGDWGKKGVPE